MKSPFLTSLFILTLLSTSQLFGQNIRADSNGILKCEKATIGDTTTITGNIYVVVDKEMLRKRIEDYSTPLYVCTSHITDMEQLFADAAQFNGDIGNWDVGQVTNMANMFSGATNYNGDIGNWDVGQVTNMANMFSGATNYNGDIGNWDVGQVTNLANMFSGATNYNGDIGNWDVGQVTNMNSMF